MSKRSADDVPLVLNRHEEEPEVDDTDVEQELDVADDEVAIDAAVEDVAVEEELEVDDADVEQELDGAVDQGAIDEALQIVYAKHESSSGNTPTTVSVGLPIDPMYTPSDHAGRMLCNLIYHKESDEDALAAGCYKQTKTGVKFTNCKCVFHLSGQVRSEFFALGGSVNPANTTQAHKAALRAIQRRYLPLLRKVVDIALPIASAEECNPEARSTVQEEDLFIEFLSKVIPHSTNTSRNISPHFFYDTGVVLPAAAANGIQLPAGSDPEVMSVCWGFFSYMIARKGNWRKFFSFQNKYLSGIEKEGKPNYAYYIRQIGIRLLKSKTVNCFWKIFIEAGCRVHFAEQNTGY